MNPLPDQPAAAATGPHTLYTGHRGKADRYVVEVTRGDRPPYRLEKQVSDVAWGRMPEPPPWLELTMRDMEEATWRCRVQALAFAILSDHFRDDGVAAALCTEFAEHVLATFDRDGEWTITDRQIAAWYELREMSPAVGEPAAVDQPPPT